MLFVLATRPIVRSSSHCVALPCCIWCITESSQARIHFNQHLSGGFGFPILCIVVVWKAQISWTQETLPLWRRPTVHQHHTRTGRRIIQDGPEFISLACVPVVPELSGSRTEHLYSEPNIPNHVVCSGVVAVCVAGLQTNAVQTPLPQHTAVVVHHLLTRYCRLQLPSFDNSHDKCIVCTNDGYCGRCVALH